MKKNNKCQYADKQNEDITTLKTEMKDTRDFIKEMSDNHLPHINEEINKINQKLAYYIGGVSVFFVIVQLVIQFIMR